ncbi:MAG TPA: glycine--tRNA ligase [Nautiliaceae bacterium]|nr:glycine--tRNA ligase [Nautiliaceae bacterium]
MDLEFIYNWALKNTFFYPTAEIYNPLSGFYEYGSLGTLLKRNWEELWKNYFLNEENFWEIEGRSILPEKVLIASGHVENFNDPLIECKYCKERLRADKLVEEKLNIEAEGLTSKELEEIIKKNKLKCPKCGKELENEVRLFNLMFEISVGPISEKTYILDLINLAKKGEIKEELVLKVLDRLKENYEEKIKAYLRPETAQSAYLNFKREFEAHRQKLPLGLAIIGTAFRNEISPRQALFRLREFTQAELQIFFDPKKINELKKEDLKEFNNLKITYKDNQNKKEGELSFKEFIKHFSLPSMYAYYLGKTYNFLVNVVGLKKIRVKRLSDEEKAFYNKIHFDFEYYFDSLKGWKEIAGLHYRTDYDLKNHSKYSGKDLAININEKKVIPHVIEISFGVDRNILAIIDNFLVKEKTEKEERILFKIKKELSPIKIAVFPLLRNRKELVKKAKEIYDLLNSYFKDYKFKIFYDEKGSIGRRYRRQDEIGTPYCITVDFDTLKDDTVTVRDRDTMKQERIKIKELINYFKNNFN